MLNPTNYIALAALVVSLFSLWYTYRSTRRQATEEIIDEFLSPQFLVHRAVVSSLRRKVMSGDVRLAEIAAGFWYPGMPKNYYTGDMVDTLNEHQHLTIFICYIRRLAHRVRSNNPNRSQLRNRLRSDYRWHGDLLNALAKEVRKQVPANEELPSWVVDVEELACLLEIRDELTADPANGERNKSTA